jgi:hypothetical protein
VSSISEPIDAWQRPIRRPILVCRVAEHPTSDAKTDRAST